MTSKKTAKAKGTGRYRILCKDLAYPTDTAAIERFLEGDRSDETRAELNASREIHERGEVVDNIPPSSVPHELEAGNIEEVA
jgi:hypothetical protein